MVSPLHRMIRFQMPEGVAYPFNIVCSILYSGISKVQYGGRMIRSVHSFYTRILLTSASLKSVGSARLPVGFGIRNQSI